jgi:hypothetical protein
LVHRSESNLMHHTASSLVILGDSLCTLLAIGALLVSATIKQAQSHRSACIKFGELLRIEQLDASRSVELLCGSLGTVCPVPRWLLLLSMVYPRSATSLLMIRNTLLRVAPLGWSIAWNWHHVVLRWNSSEMSLLVRASLGILLVLGTSPLGTERNQRNLVPHKCVIKVTQSHIRSVY